MRQFIPNYAKIVKGITNMLEKGTEVKWNLVPHDSFSRIKKYLVEALVLASPNYLVLFYIFSFASPHTIVVVLLQKNKVGYEQPIAFFSQVLRDIELGYNALKKQSYTLVKALKVFRVYVFQLKITTFVPTTMVKDILVQGDSEGKSGRWIMKIQEYELEINPTKIIKGQALTKFLSKSNFQSLGINLTTEEDKPEDH